MKDSCANEKLNIEHTMFNLSGKIGMIHAAAARASHAVFSDTTVVGSG
jgi:hypothetical protein